MTRSAASATQARGPKTMGQLLLIPALLGATTALGETAFVRIGDPTSAGGDQHHLFVAAAPGVDSVTICENTTPEACAPQSQNAVRTRLAASRPDRRIFQTETAILLRGGLRLAIAARSNSGTLIDRSLIDLAPQATGGGTVVAGARIKLQELSFAIPQGYRVHQDAVARGTIIVGLQGGRNYLRIYVRQGAAPDMRQTFASAGAQISRPESSSAAAGINWRQMGTRKSSEGGAISVAAFSGERGGYAYWGFAASPEGDPAQVINSFLGSAQ